MPAFGRLLSALLSEIPFGEIDPDAPLTWRYDSQGRAQFAVEERLYTVLGIGVSEDGEVVPIPGEDVAVLRYRRTRRGEELVRFRGRRREARGIVGPGVGLGKPEDN